MSASCRLRPALAPGSSCSQFLRFSRQCPRRRLHVDHRSRLSQFWVPPPQVAKKDVKANEESHDKLVRAGFFRQAHSGVFHMLPLGLRVQDKIEALVDKHMRFIGASRVSMSSITSAELWQRSGRLESIKSELFQFEDRKNAKFLLAPTHEEEITHLVAQSVQSYQDLPLRLYQISRKYRDEMRPRHGILRSREFVMKDLYTFDTTVEAALATYAEVRAAYDAIFAELKVPVRAARASSGDMGGDLSHEYHLSAALGEDDVASCRACGFAGNTEVVRGQEAPESGRPSFMVRKARVWRGISRDRTTLVNVWYPGEMGPVAGGQAAADETETVSLTDNDVDVPAIKDVVPDLDAGRRDAVQLGQQLLGQAVASKKSGSHADKPIKMINLVDWRLSSTGFAVEGTASWPDVSVPDASVAEVADVSVVTADATTGTPFRFIRARTGDDCPSCGAAGTLQIEQALELGHAFYLGTRYSEPLELRVQGRTPSDPLLTPFMGCYGIGISRILGAVADHLADSAGLNWPRAIAPYEVVVVAAHNEPMASAAEGVYDELVAGAQPNQSAPLDVLLDDRKSNLPYKLHDADIVGYPVIVVVGAAWKKSTDQQTASDQTLSPDGLCEVQCRRLNVRQNVPLRELRSFVQGLLEKL